MASYMLWQTYFTQRNSVHTQLLKVLAINSQNDHLQHIQLWLCSGYLLYFTLGKHIVYYSHSIHILYICMYTFLLSSRKSVQALLPAILWSDHRLHYSYLLLHRDQKQVGAWGCWYIVRFLTYSGHPTLTRLRDAHNKFPFLWGTGCLFMFTRMDPGVHLK